MSNTIREHPDRVVEKRPDGLFSDEHPYSVTRTDGFGSGSYTNWIVSSRAQPLFQKRYTDWYENHTDKRRKVVPEDYSLDETALLHCYWGDGNCSLRESGAPWVSFATHWFPESSVDTLQSELERLGYENYTSHQNGVVTGSGLAVRLSAGSSREFLEDMRPRNTLSKYEYKFPVAEA